MMLVMFHRHPLPTGRVYDWTLRKERDARPEDVREVVIKGEKGNIVISNYGEKGKAIAVSYRTIFIQFYWNITLPRHEGISAIWWEMQRGLHPGVLFDYLEDELLEDAVVREVVDLVAETRPALEKYARRLLRCPGNWIDPAARAQLKNLKKERR